MLDIRSVYDFDGAIAQHRRRHPDIATLANPALRTAAQRPARFLRIEKAVSHRRRRPGLPGHRLNAAFGTRELHARDPGLRADRARWLGVGARAGQRGLRDLDARREWPAPLPGASQLAADAPRRDPPLQWLPPGSHRRCAWIVPMAAMAPAFVWAGAAASGRAASPAPLAGYSPPMRGRHHGPGARAHHLRARGSACSQHAQRERGLRRCLDGSGRLPNRAADASFSYTYGGAGGLNTPPPVRAELPCPPGAAPAASSSTTSSTSIRCGTLDRGCAIRRQHLHQLPHACHDRSIRPNVPRVPAGQLDLSDGDSQRAAAAHDRLSRTAVRRQRAGSSSAASLQDRLVP